MSSEFNRKVTGIVPDKAQNYYLGGTENGDILIEKGDKPAIYMRRGLENYCLTDDVKTINGQTADENNAVDFDYVKSISGSWNWTEETSGDIVLSVKNDLNINEPITILATQCILTTLRNESTVVHSFDFRGDLPITTNVTSCITSVDGTIPFEQNYNIKTSGFSTLATGIVTNESNVVGTAELVATNANNAWQLTIITTYEGTTQTVSFPPPSYWGARIVGIPMYDMKTGNEIPTDESGFEDDGGDSGTIENDFGDEDEFDITIDPIG